MHLHWLILFLVSLAVTATDHPSATRSLLHQTFSSNTSQGRVSDTKVCTASEYGKARIQLWKDLGLDKKDSQNANICPLMFNKDYYTYYANNPANIYVDLYVTSITNVNEKAHSLTTQVKMITAWPNFNMSWDPERYCGIETFSAPKNVFWIPDIGIIESAKTDFGTKESPNVMLLSGGFTVSTEIFALITACKMDLYKFPFDTQTCRITLQSTAYTAQEIELFTLSANKTLFTMKSKEFFQAEGEWEFIRIDNSSATVEGSLEWIQMHQLAYQIIIKRRPLLYVVNIIVPVFFFLVLDVISFFIEAKGEKKVAFKVTLLLSISVMLLLVNNMLPSTADKIPLIGIYCCTIFCLLGISIVETVVVDFIKHKGDKKKSVETTSTVTGRDDGARGQQILTEVQAGTQRNQQQKQFLTKVAENINRTFLVLYIITIIVFMSVLWSLWYP